MLSAAQLIILLFSCCFFFSFLCFCCYICCLVAFTTAGRSTSRALVRRDLLENFHRNAFTNFCCCLLLLLALTMLCCHCICLPLSVACLSPPTSSLPTYLIVALFCLLLFSASTIWRWMHWNHLHVAFAVLKKSSNQLLQRVACMYAYTYVWIEYVYFFYRSLSS